MMLMFPVRSPGRPRIRTQEERRAIKRAWYAANRERVRAVKAAYRNAHRDRICKGFRDWYARNKDRVASRRLVRLSMPVAFRQLSCRPWRVTA